MRVFMHTCVCARAFVCMERERRECRQFYPVFWFFWFRSDGCLSTFPVVHKTVDRTLKEAKQASKQTSKQAIGHQHVLHVAWS